MDDLDGRIDALFAGPPGAFTAARDTLAKELRDAGDRETGDVVKALRRPTRLAAELNRIARDDPGGLAALIVATDELAAAQAAMVAGAGGARELRDAGAAEGAALAALSNDGALRTALRTATRAEGLRDDLRGGRLIADPGRAGGDGLFASAPAAATTRRAPATPTPTTPPPEPEPGPDAPNDELAAARARRVREKALVEARRLVDAAVDAEDEAAEALDSAAARSAAARAAHDAAGAGVDAARRALQSAEATDAAARAEVEAATVAEDTARSDAEAAAAVAAQARDAFTAAAD